MNIKKLIVTGAAAAMVFGSAAGAFAGHSSRHHSTPAPLPATTVTNTGGIDNVSVNVANTGLNYAGGASNQEQSRHGRNHSKNNGVSITTGDATALQLTDNEINTSAGCGCAGGGNTTVLNNGGVDNLSVNVANSGLNWVSGGKVTTGDAFAGQGVFNVINTSVE